MKWNGESGIDLMPQGIDNITVNQVNITLMLIIRNIQKLSEKSRNETSLL